MEVKCQTRLISLSRLSHIEATIFDMSPNVALGFRVFMADCALRKNSEYADTGLKQEHQTELEIYSASKVLQRNLQIRKSLITGTDSWLLKYP